MDSAATPRSACSETLASRNDGQLIHPGWFSVFELLECHKTEIVVRGPSQRSIQRSYSSASQQSNLSDATSNRPPVLDLAYCRAGASYENYLATADEAGNVSILNTGCTPIESPTAALTVHNNAIFRIEWIPGTQCLVTGSGDSNSSVIDINASQIVATTSGHRGTVRSLAIKPDSGSRSDNGQVIFASGGRDGAVCVYDTRVSDSADAGSSSNLGGGNLAPVHSLQGAHLHKAVERTPTPKRGSRLRKSVPKSSVTSIQFLNGNLFATCGLPDGQIKFWDMRKLPNYGSSTKDLRPYVVRSIDYTGNDREAANFLHLSATADGSKLYATADDNVIYEYSTTILSAVEGATEWLRVFRGANVKSFYARSSISPDLKYLASGSSDCCIYLWDLVCAAVSTTQPYRLKGHEEEVAVVAWHGSQRYQLASCSDDASVLIWRNREANASATNNAASALADDIHECLRKHDGKWVKTEEDADLNSLETPKKVAIVYASSEKIKFEND